MKFVIVGPAFSGNKGAASMLEATVQTLTKAYPKASFTLLSHYPKEDARLNPYQHLAVVSAKPLELGLIINPAALAYLALPFLRPLIIAKLPSIKAIAEADLVLEEGGITFADGRTKYLLFNVATILPALLLRKPVFKVAQALGPFKTPINRLVSKLVLPRMAKIVARGAYTAANLRDLGLNNIVEGADYAFAMEITPAQKRPARTYLKHAIFKAKAKVVGVAPSVVLKNHAEAKGEDYVGETVAFIDYLTDQGYGVLLVPHSVRSNTAKLHNNDLPLVQEIYARLKAPEQICLVDKELDSQPMRYLIGQCDMFVASRFHAMVSALAMGVPVLVIGWSHKYAEVLQMFGVEEWAFARDKLTLDSLKQHFNRFAKERAKIAAKLKKNLPKVKQLSLEQVDHIKEFINGQN